MYDELAGSGDLLRDHAPPDDAGALRFRRERDLGDVVNATFRFLRDNARELGRGLLVIAGPVALLAALASAWAQLQMETAFQGPLDPGDPSALFGSRGYVTGLFATVLSVVVMQLLIQAVVLGYVERYRRGEAGALTPARLWEATKAAFGPVLTTTLAALGLVFVAFFAASLLTAAVPVLGLLAMLALLVGMIYLMPVITLLYVERVVEGDGFWEGLAATRGYVSGHWWQTFGLLFVVGVVVFGIMMVLSIPAMLVQAAFGFNTLEGGGGAEVVALAVSALLGVVVYAAYAIPVTAAAFQYFNLVERKEGTGLLARVEAMGGRREEAPRPPVPSPAPSWRPPEETPEEVAPPEVRPSERGFRGGGFRDETEGPAGPR